MANQVQSLARAFSVIEYLSAHDKPVPLGDVSRACKLPAATAHRLLASLCELGYVINAGAGRYQMSLRLFEVTSGAVSGTSLVTVARPHLDRLSEQVGESAHLVVRDGGDVVYIHKVTRSIGSIQMVSRIGMRLPMYRCAVGKSILATLPRSEVRQIFADSDVVAVTPNTITDLDTLLDQIELIRDRGYAVDDEENEEGVKCVAVALGREGDAAEYAFSVSSLAGRMDDERIRELADMMLETRAKILRELALS